jgi:DNA-binding transcriptional ArsR family regulator
MRGTRAGTGLTAVAVSRNLPFVVTNASAMMTALGDPTRQAILERLSDGPRPVGELAAGLPVSRPAVSQHLKVLKDVGLVVDHQVGTRRLYRVDPAALALLRSHLDQFWQRSLEAFESAVRDQEGTSDDPDR